MNLEPLASPPSEEEINLIDLPPSDKKTTGPVSPQGDSGATPEAGRNGERVGNRANGCR